MAPTHAAESGRPMTPGPHRGSRRVCLAALVLAGAAAVAHAGIQEQPTFPSGIALVKVDVVVVDRDGKPVRGLTRADFRVFDEGRERPVVSFEAVVAPSPMTEAEAKPPRVSTNIGDGARAAKPLLLFVLDGMRPSLMGTLRATKVLREFVDANPGLDADVTFASTDSAKTWTGRARDLRAPGDFDRVISGVLGTPAPTGANLDPRGLNSAIAPAVVPRRSQAAMGRMAEDTRSKALTEMIERFSAGRAGRTTMILLTEGVIVGPFNRRTDDVVGPAARNRVVIYGLDVRGLTAPSTGADSTSMPDSDGADGARPRFRMDSSESWAEELAQATGGRNVRGTEGLGPALAGFVEESLSYYLLGFEPDAGARPGRMRSMKVKLAQGGYDVRARPAYMLPRPGEGPQAGPPLPLAVAAFVGRPAKEGRSSVRLVLEVDPASLEPAPGDGGGRVTLESEVDFVPMAGGKVRREEHRDEVRVTPQLRKSLGDDAWLPLVRAVDLNPGRYEARVVLRDPATGRSGAVKHPFEVPGVGALRLTTPVISDLFHPDGSPREVARARFDPVRVVECVFEALGAAPVPGGQPHLLARWSLISPAGEEVRHGELEGTGANGARFAFPLPLATLADGSYTLSLTVRDTTSGAVAEGKERVEVARSARNGAR